MSIIKPILVSVTRFNECRLGRTIVGQRAGLFVVSPFGFVRRTCGLRMGVSKARLRRSVILPRLCPMNLYILSASTSRRTCFMFKCCRCGNRLVIFLMLRKSTYVIRNGGKIKEGREREVERKRRRRRKEEGRKERKKERKERKTERKKESV